MKKLFIYASLLAAVFTSCDPIEDRNDNMGGAITADELKVTATPVVVNGVRSNKIVVENSSPCLSNWDYVMGTSAKAYDEVLVSEVGDLVITFTGLNADGTKITKELPVNVEAILFQPFDMDRFFGNGTWVFDQFTNEIALGDVEGVFPYGTTSYGNKAPTINGALAGDFDQADAKFSFFFKDGASFTKTLADGTVQKGTFSYDLTKPVSDWSLGTVTLKGATIPNPYAWDKKGGEAYKFYVLVLEEDQIVLATAADNKVVSDPSAQVINVWMFRPEGWEPKGAEEQIELITGGDSKTWTWDSKAEAVFGNGPYLIGSGPEWWKVTIAEMDGMASGEGKGATMTFSTDGTMVKTKADGSTVSGTYEINMNKPTFKEDGTTIWAMGKLKMTGVGVLRPDAPAGGAIDAWDILTLTENNMSLSYIEKGAGAWGAAHFWMFQVK